MERSTIIEAIKLALDAMGNYNGCKASGLSEHQYPKVWELYKSLQGNDEMVSCLFDEFLRDHCRKSSRETIPW